MSHKLAVLVVEPSDIIREGLASILSHDDDIYLLAPLRDADDLALRLPTIQPDLMIINPTLLPCPARVQLSNIQVACPNMPVVALLYQYVDPQLMQGFKYVLDIRENGNRIAQYLHECMPEDSDPESAQECYELSDRETEVLVLVAQGLSSKAIADQLNISIHTVNTHRKNITRKTGIKSVAGLAVYAMLHNLC